MGLLVPVTIGALIYYVWWPIVEPLVNCYAGNAAYCF